MSLRWQLCWVDSHLFPHLTPRSPRVLESAGLAYSVVTDCEGLSMFSASDCVWLVLHWDLRANKDISSQVLMFGAKHKLSLGDPG